MPCMVCVVKRHIVQNEGYQYNQSESVQAFPELFVLKHQMLRGTWTCSVLCRNDYDLLLFGPLMIVIAMETENLNNNNGWSRSRNYNKPDQSEEEEEPQNKISTRHIGRGERGPSKLLPQLMVIEGVFVRSFVYSLTFRTFLQCFVAYDVEVKVSGAIIRIEVWGQGQGQS